MTPDISSQDPKQEGDMHNQTIVKFEKNLASPDKAKREKAMSLLCLWLTSQKEIEEVELTKIWKGLLYCLWHAEMEAAQVDLVNRMTLLMEKLDVELCLQFFKVFLTSLRNEWEGIDNGSLGRFHLLLKHYVSRMFAVLQKSEWAVEVVRKFMDALSERALLVQDAIDANGMNVYIVGVFLNELSHYLPISACVFEVLLEPFWVALSKGCDDKVAEEICKKVFLVLFDHGSGLLMRDQRSHASNAVEKACFGDVALNLSLLIRTKNLESKSAHLRLVEEKFSYLKELAQSRMWDNAVVSNDRVETQGINCSAQSADRLEDSRSPAQIPAMQTFGRRLKRNQKLLFSPQTIDEVYMRKSVETLDTILEDIPVQAMKEGMRTHQGSEVANCGRSISLDKGQMDMVASKSEFDLQVGDVIDVDGSPPNQDTLTSDEADSNNMHAATDDGIDMEDSVISNLAKRFESIADQSLCCEVKGSSILSTPLAPSPINTGSRKRKSWKMSPTNALDSGSPTRAKENNVVLHDPFQEDEITSIDNFSAKSAKKVHFSLQHNIIWQPLTPLPPHDLRVPPAATPRGSALKKGVPPGPIVEPSDVLVISPKRKKATPRRAPSAHSRSPKGLKNSAKVRKPTKKGNLSPR